ncbi:MAG: hypothetical protein H0Z33_02190 [Bacillaceae bacterium]|nr:hypothetical protein [Bacillaceae bacterium]
MGTSLEKYILAVITMDPQKVSGGAPIFYAENEDEMQKTAFTLEKILDGMAHDVKNGTMIIVKHF